VLAMPQQRLMVDRAIRHERRRKRHPQTLDPIRHRRLQFVAAV